VTILTERIYICAVTVIASIHSTVINTVLTFVALESAWALAVGSLAVSLNALMSLGALSITTTALGDVYARVSDLVGKLGVADALKASVIVVALIEPTSAGVSAASALIGIDALRFVVISVGTVESSVALALEITIKVKTGRFCIRGTGVRVIALI